MGLSKCSYKYLNWGLSSYQYSYLVYNITLVTKSHEPLSVVEGASNAAYRLK